MTDTEMSVFILMTMLSVIKQYVAIKLTLMVILIVPQHGEEEKEEDTFDNIYQTWHAKNCKCYSCKKWRHGIALKRYRAALRDSKIARLYEEQNKESHYDKLQKMKPKQMSLNLSMIQRQDKIFFGSGTVQKDIDGEIIGKFSSSKKVHSKKHPEVSQLVASGSRRYERACRLLVNYALVHRLDKNICSNLTWRVGDNISMDVLYSNGKKYKIVTAAYDNFVPHLKYREKNAMKTRLVSVFQTE